MRCRNRSPYRSIISATRSMSVASRPRPMMFVMMTIVMRPQPSDSFVWVQASGGPALVCGALRPIADHLFTTRSWSLGSVTDAGDAEWRPVATAVGVDLAHLIHVRQVHGTSLVVRHPGDP